MSKNGRKPQTTAEEFIQVSLTSAPMSLVEKVDADAERFDRSRAAQIISILKEWYSNKEVATAK